MKIIYHLITQPMHSSTFYLQTFPHHLNHGVRKEIQRLQNIYSLKSKSTSCPFTLRMVETTTVMYIVKETGTHLLHEWVIPIYFHALEENETKMWTGMIKVPFYTVNTTKGRKTTNHSLTVSLLYFSQRLVLHSYLCTFPR